LIKRDLVQFNIIGLLDLKRKKLGYLISFPETIFIILSDVLYEKEKLCVLYRYREMLLQEIKKHSITESKQKLHF